MTETELPHVDIRRSRLAVRFAAAAAGAVALNSVIAVVADAAGASDAFDPLAPSAYVTFTLIGFLAGATGWAVIRARASDPARVLRFLVPSVLALSFVPDVALGFSDRPGTSWGAVAALAAMHVVVTASVVLACRTTLQLAAGP